MTLARNILLDIQKPRACPLLSQEHLLKIEKILPELDIVRKHPHPNQDSETIEITPCTEEGMVTLEAQLKSKVMDRDLFSDFFDQFQLCNSLNEVEFFDKMNCSAKMGYALGERKGKRAHVFKTGKIIMRRANDKDDALNTLSDISRLLMPARLCSCNNTLVDCFGGSCESCTKGTCAALVDAVNTNEDYHKDGLTVGEVLKGMDFNDNEMLLENFKLLSDFVSEIRKIHNKLKEGRLKDSEEIKGKTDEIAEKLLRNCMEYVLLRTDMKETVIALTQYGVGRDLVRARDGLLSLNEGIEDELYNEAIDLFFDAFSAFEQKDDTVCGEIEKRFGEFMLVYEKSSLPWGLFKVAANGFYISRVLGKPVPG
jgi:hypothetical protein